MATEQWHLNKSVPIALIFAIFVQTVGAVWWASSINSQVTELALRIQESAAEASEVRRDFESENLRQWARINSVEVASRDTAAELNTVNAILSRLEKSVEENNVLLKEYLRGTAAN